MEEDCINERGRGIERQRQTETGTQTGGQVERMGMMKREWMKDAEMGGREGGEREREREKETEREGGGEGETERERQRERQREREFCS